MALKRNDTGFPVKITEKLRELYKQYISAQLNINDADHDLASTLKYYQYLVRTIMSDPEYGIGLDGNARGLLIYHMMGMGKTRLAVAIAIALCDVLPVVVMLPRSLQDNFKETTIAVIKLLNPRASPEKIAQLCKDIETKFTFVSMDAYNSAEQMTRASKSSGVLDDKLLIVDEAHNFFRSIINSNESNARRIYDIIMAARNLKIVFLTGSPAVKDPFELVPCFNMLTGKNILPDQYEIFYKLYVDSENHAVRNREKLSNRIVGLVSHVTLTKPSVPTELSSGQKVHSAINKKVRDDQWFPEEFPTIVERVEMGSEQYKQYLIVREKEELEGKTGDGSGGFKVEHITSPPLSLPGSAKKMMRTYFVKSRIISTFCPPRDWAGVSISEMPDEIFNEVNAPKLALIADRTDKSPGPVLIYSQFVDSGGLGAISRILKNRGYMPFVIDKTFEYEGVIDKTVVQKHGGVMTTTEKVRDRTFSICGTADPSLWDTLRAGLKGWVEVPIDSQEHIDLVYGVSTVIIFLFDNSLDGTKYSARFDPRFTRQHATIKSVLNDEKEPLLSRWEFYQRTLKASPEAAEVLPYTRRLSDVMKIDDGEVLIIKKEHSWGQEGISIVSTNEELANIKERMKASNTSAVASQYIKPLVSNDGLVFSIRMHTLVTTFNGIARVYTFLNDGCPTSLLPYEEGNWSKIESHISSAAWTTKRVMWPIHFNFSPEKLASINDGLAKISRVLGAALAPVAQSFPESEGGFEVLGADIAFDKNGKSWLLEINSKCGLRNRPPSQFPDSPDYTPENAERAAITIKSNTKYMNWILDCFIKPTFNLTPFPPAAFECKAMPTLHTLPPKQDIIALKPSFSLSGRGGLDFTWIKANLTYRGFIEYQAGVDFVNFAWGELMHGNQEGGRYDSQFTAQHAELKSILNDSKQVVTDKTQLYATLGPQSFLPKTRAISDVMHILDGEVLILKKAGGWHRKGVVVVDNDKALKEYKSVYGSHGVASNYIRNPMLCDGRKFHLRIHLMIYVRSGIGSSYYYPKHQIITAAEKYVDSDWENINIHLSGSESTEKYYEWPLYCDGNDLPAGPKSAKAATTILEILTAVSAAIASNAAPYPESYAAFEVFGLDVMFDSTGQAFLLEVNDKVGHSWDVAMGEPSPEKYGKSIFSWILNSVVLPHFGLAPAVTPHWIGSLTGLAAGPLSPYIDLITLGLKLTLFEHASTIQLESISYMVAFREVYMTLGNGSPWDGTKIASLLSQAAADSRELQRKYYHWAIVLQNNAVGYVGIRPYNDTIQLRYFVGIDYQKKGIATAAIAMALEMYASLFAPASPTICANVAHGNAASIKVLTKLGFVEQNGTRIGKVNLKSYNRLARIEHPKSILGAAVPKEDYVEITNDFPYRKLYMQPFCKMVAALSQQVISVHMQYGRGRLAIVERSFPEDFDNADSITDWEAEPVRILCNEKGEQSPSDAWLLIRDMKDLPADISVRRELVYSASRGCNLFNISLGIYLLSYSNARDILDPTAGWGDRLGAAFISGAKSYRGWDTNVALQPVYNKLAKRYENEGFKLDWKIQTTPFEQTPDIEIANKFDTVMTSPPFYDKELYGGDATSTSEYKSINEWYTKFYNIIWKKSAIALRPGGHIFAYIPSGRMKTEAMRVLLAAGLEYVGAIGFKQNANGTIRDTFVWRRKANGGAPLSKDAELQELKELKESQELKELQELKKIKGYYAIISGETLSADRSLIRKIFNSVENAHGELIKAILISKTGAEGLDLKWIRETHQIESYWDKSRDHQLVARAVRLGSHDGLPPNERDVQPYLYIAVANKTIYDQLPVRGRELKTIDEIFYDRANERYKTIFAFRQLLTEVCLECELFGYGSCRVCVPTDAPLFHNDFALDIRLSDPCKTLLESEVEASLIEFEGVTYYYKKDENGYTFYEYRNDLGGYSTMDPSDLKSHELLKLLTE